MPLLELASLRKSYGPVLAVDDVSLSMEEGEILCLLGPSGCGKTTILRMIAGLETPDSGTLRFQGQSIEHLSPQARRFGMVFQSYALFPHMSVFENVAFGLRVRGTEQAELERRVVEALELVQLAPKRGRAVHQLSGGEQQRVAVARAVVIQPRLLLLDEPLSNLDASLREATRVLLRRLIRSLGISAVFVTHDQEEAFAVGDRVAVLRLGVLQQIGSPDRIYDEPANLFVSGFIGRSNVLKVEAREGSPEFMVDGQLWKGGRPASQSGPLAAVFRPERILLESAPQNSATVEILDVQRTVQGLTLGARLGGERIEIRPPAGRGRGGWTPGQSLQIHVPPEAIHLFPLPSSGHDA